MTLHEYHGYLSLCDILISCCPEFMTDRYCLNPLVFTFVATTHILTCRSFGCSTTGTWNSGYHSTDAAALRCRCPALRMSSTADSATCVCCHRCCRCVHDIMRPYHRAIRSWSGRRPAVGVACTAATLRLLPYMIRFMYYVLRSSVQSTW